jgi:hypothetical protein
MYKYFFFLMIVGCSSDAFIGGDDGGDGGKSGDPSDALNGDAKDSDAATLDDGLGNSDVITDGGSSADGYDGYTSLPYRRVFITSQTYKASFGGLVKADQICNSAASLAGLTGTWSAWLSTVATSATSRLEHATVPYQLLDGTVLAANWTELTSGNLRHPIDRDENNNVVPPTPPPFHAPFTGFAWTGTNTDGTSLTNTCDDWTYSIPSGSNLYTGISGVNNYGEDGGATGQLWTVGDDTNCVDMYAYSLYCFEQP